MNQIKNNEVKRMAKAKIKDEVLGEVEFEAKGVMPIFAQKGCSLDSLAESLKKTTAQEIPFRRIPVPVDAETYARMSYICDTYNTSFAQLMSDLVGIALPELEEKLGVKEQDVVEHFNQNKPKGYEDVTAITLNQLNEAMKGVK